MGGGWRGEYLEVDVVGADIHGDAEKQPEFVHDDARCGVAADVVRETLEPVGGVEEDGREGETEDHAEEVDDGVAEADTTRDGVFGHDLDDGDGDGVAGEEGHGGGEDEGGVAKVF